MNIRRGRWSDAGYLYGGNLAQLAQQIRRAREMSILNRDTLNAMAASRKADREYIVRALLQIASDHGATVDRSDEPANPGYHGQGVHLEFRNNGVGAMIDIDGCFEGSTALISWFNSQRPARNFTSRFESVVLVRTIRQPHHKATSIPRNWYSLAMALDAGLMLAQRSEAFEPSATS